MRRFGKLSPAAIAQIKEVGRFGDGNGLWLQCTKSGDHLAKSWILRYQLAHRVREMGLGPLADVGLKEARDKAREAHRLLNDGVDPIDVRRAKKAELMAEASKQVLFRQAAERFIESHKAGWKHASKSAAQWKASLEAYAFPTIGNLDVRHVDVGHIVKILEPIWTTKTVTAKRVRQRVEHILDWAKARKYRSGENPARWRGHLDRLLPQLSRRRKPKHQPALPYAELPEFMSELYRNNSISALALQFTILTAARTSEVILAEWSEIDFEKRIWTCPGERTKSGRDHRVPLSDRALKILKSVPREDGNKFVFPGAKEKNPLSNMSMLELLRGMRKGITVHGFRSTFRDWVEEQTSYAGTIAEAALAHVVGDETERAYRRGDLFEKRKRLMNDWTRYCESHGVSTGKKVVPIRGRK